MYNCLYIYNLKNNYSEKHCNISKSEAERLAKNAKAYGCEYNFVSMGKEIKLVVR